MQCYTQHEPSDRHLHFVYLQLEKAAFGLGFEKAEIIPLFTLDNNSKKSVKFSLLSKKDKKDAHSEIKA